MTVLQITPTSSELLQHVADSLGKAKKVVLITGAGISTNSGIPDFRSENGLYSLIQAQFERAEAGRHAEPDVQATDFPVSGRPTKRRRISRPVEGLTEYEDSTEAARLPNDSKHKAPADTSVNGTNMVAEPRALCVPHDIPVKSETVTPAEPLLQRLTRSQSGLRPPSPLNTSQSSTQSFDTEESLFSGSRFSNTSPQTCDSAVCVGKAPNDVQMSHITQRAVSATFSSSPLSSPPPILFDPYENINSSTESSSQGSAESPEASDLEDTQNPLELLSSRTSNPSLRNMKGRDLFDCNIWADPLKTSVFYRFATTLRQKIKEVEPTTTHRFIAQLRDVGKLARVYTQNIDEIEKKIGLSTDLKNGAGNRRRRSAKHQFSDQEKALKEREGAGKGDDVENSQSSRGLEICGRSGTRSLLAQDRGVECVFLHGSLHALRCFVCGKLCDWDEAGRESCTMLGEQPECPHCAGATAARQEKGKRALGVGKLRPDIVLYGEEHPQSDLISPIVQHDLSAGPDLLLILGTSLRVHGLKVMVKEFAKAVHNKGGKVVFINLTKPSDSVWGDIIDYWIEWDCDAWVDDLKYRKPHLWLSPGEILESEKQRREALAEKKRESILKKRGRVEGSGGRFGEKRRHTIEVDKPRPPPKNPSSMRNDYQCGAYVVWEIFQTLAKIGNRPFDNLGYTPPHHSLPAAPPPIPASQGIPAAKARKTRKSAPVTLVTSSSPGRKPKAAVKPGLLASHDSRSQYAKAARELARAGKSPTPARLAELNRAATSLYTPPSSITAAVKVHPRQRKPKIIEGVPFSTTATRIKRPSRPDSTPLRGAEKEDAPKTGSTHLHKGPMLPPLNPGWERSPPARIKPLEPSLNISPHSPLADLPPIARPQIFSIRQATHPMVFSDPLIKLRYETTNYKKPPKDAGSAAYDKPPSPSDQLRWELAQQEALEGAQALEGLKCSR